MKFQKRMVCVVRNYKGEYSYLWAILDLLSFLSHDFNQIGQIDRVREHSELDAADTIGRAVAQREGHVIAAQSLHQFLVQVRNLNRSKIIRHFHTKTFNLLFLGAIPIRCVCLFDDRGYVAETRNYLKKKKKTNKNEILRGWTKFRFFIKKKKTTNQTAPTPAHFWMGTIVSEGNSSLNSTNFCLAATVESTILRMSVSCRMNDCTWSTDEFRSAKSILYHMENEDNVHNFKRPMVEFWYGQKVSLSSTTIEKTRKKKKYDQKLTSGMFERTESKSSAVIAAQLHHVDA